MSVDASLEVIPKILDGIEVRTPWWEIDDVDSMVMKPGVRGAGIVRRCIVLLVPPLSFRPEDMSSLDEIQCKNRLIASRIQCALIQLGMS